MTPRIGGPVMIDGELYITVAEARRMYDYVSIRLTEVRKRLGLIERRYRGQCFLLLSSVESKLGPMVPPEGFITAREAAAQVGYSVEYVINLIQWGRIGGTKARVRGKASPPEYFIRLEDLQRWAATAKMGRPWPIEGGTNGDEKAAK